MGLDGRGAIVTRGTRGVSGGIGRELTRQGAHVFISGRSALDHEHFGERITGIRYDHRVDNQVEAAFNLILRETSDNDILVNNVWGGYERMVQDGDFTWARPFWETARVAMGRDVQRHCRASQLVAPAMIARRRGMIVKHLVLGGTEAYRQCRLWRVESRNGQDDVPYNLKS